MKNIIKSFFELYEKGFLIVNWEKTNLGFRFKDDSISMELLINDLYNTLDDEEVEIDKKEVVNTYFSIMMNRINDSFNKDFFIEGEDGSINEYINENIKPELVAEISNDIFLDNNINGDRLSNVASEILSKRDNKNIDIIKDYTAVISLEINKKPEDTKVVNIELTEKEIDTLIELLQETKQNMNSIK